jgi:hypothetical protein
MAASHGGTVSGRRANMIFDAAVGAMTRWPAGAPRRVSTAAGLAARSA